MRHFRPNRTSWQARGLETWLPTVHNSRFAGTWPDMSGNGNHPVFPGGSNDPTFEFDPMLGGCYLFDDVADNYVDVPSMDTFGGTDFSFSFWYKSVDLVSEPPPDDQVIFNCADGTNQINVVITDDSPNSIGTLRLLINSASASSDRFYSTDHVMDQEWHHCAITRTPGTVRIFIDGEYNFDVGASNPDGHNQITVTGGDAKIGSEVAAEKANGRVADWRYYSRALSDGEVKALYNNRTRWDLYYTYFPPPPEQSIVRAGSRETYEASGDTTIVINKPSGTVEGDFLLAAIRANGSVAGYTATLAGWELARTSRGNNAHTGTVFLYKFAGGSEPSSYTFTYDSSRDARAGVITRFTGVDSYPFDGGVKEDGATGSSAVVGESVDATNAGCYIFEAITLASPSVTQTVSDLTEHNELNHLIINGDLQAATGASGDKDSTISAAGTWLSMMVAIRPDLGGHAFGSKLQSDHNSNLTGDTTITATYPTTPVEDNLMVACHFTGDGNSIAPSGWSEAVALTDGGNADQGAIYYKVAGASESKNVQPSSGSGDEHNLVIMEIQGPFDASPLDQTAWDGPTTSQAPDSTATPTTSQNDEVAIGITTVRNTNVLVNWAWSESFISSGEGRVNSNAKQVKAALRVLTATGTYKAAASWTSPGGQVWMCGIATFKQEGALGVRTSAGLPLYYRP